MNALALVLTVKLDFLWRQRFLNAAPQLFQLYDEVAVIFTPGSQLEFCDFLPNFQNLHASFMTTDAANWSLEALKFALHASSANAFHCCDGQLALARYDRSPELWSQEARLAGDHPAIIYGRNLQAWTSYPEPIRVVQRWTNAIASQWLGQDLDIGGGARGFSRPAAQCIAQQADPGIHSVASSLEWPLLLQRQGVSLAYHASSLAVFETPSSLPISSFETPNHWEKQYEIARSILYASARCLR